MLATLPASLDDNLLVGVDTLDDAAVYRVDDDTALVMTVDVITPPVDDPFLFGQIGAANALSDIYAMGARPLVALNVIGFPDDQLPAETLHGIVAGANERVLAAGAALGGGHTTRDDEPKFGLAVTGQVHPERFWSNAGAQPGDQLILTKPIGSGVLFNASRAKRLHADDLAPVIDILIELNRRAAEVFGQFSVHAATDISGFGLLGHATEIANASDVTLQLEYSEIKVFPRAEELYRQGTTTASNAANRRMAEGKVQIDTKLKPEQEEVLFDPQTSGGLLVALPAEEVPAVMAALADADVDLAAVVGRVLPPKPPFRIVVV